MKKIIFILSGLISLFIVTYYLSNRAGCFEFMTNKPTQFFTQIKYFLFETESNPSFSISIKDDEYKAIKDQRKLALKYGNGYRVHENFSGYQHCTIIYDNNKIKSKIKLKGGQLGHWGENATLISYKFKTESPVLDCDKFGIQAPGNRGYLNEFVIHNICNRIGLLAPFSKFLNISINNKDYGLYFFEEYPSERTLHRNNKSNGPILEYDASTLWKKTLVGKKYNQFSVDSLVPKFNNKTNLEIDSIAYKLLANYDTLSDYHFDIEKWAKFIALQTLCGAYYHASAIQNLNVYYNPTTNLFEPILFDQTYIQPLYEKINWSFILKKINDTHPVIMHLMKFPAFQNELELQHYKLSIKIPELLFKDIQPEINTYYKFLCIDNPTVNYLDVIDLLLLNSKSIYNILEQENKQH